MSQSKKSRPEKKILRLHVPGLPHTMINSDYCWCAYTQKIRRFIDNMKSCGHIVFSYDGPEYSNCICDPKSQTDVVSWDSSHPWWTYMAKRVASKILLQLEDEDIICLISTSQLPIYDCVKTLKKITAVEYGIGYCAFAAPYACFESYTWKQAVYASIGKGAYNANIRDLDAVIYNCYDEEELDPKFIENHQYDKSELSNEIQEVMKGKYFFFIGRNILRKGIKIAVEISKRMKIPLIIAGQKTKEYELPNISGIYHAGIVKGLDKAKLFHYAIATLVPTIYLAPWEGVHAESLLCGTPVITTDQGAFSETVENGINGWRCPVVIEAFLQACDSLIKNPLNKEKIAESAKGKFHANIIKYQYERWLYAVHADAFKK